MIEIRDSALLDQGYQFFLSMPFLVIILNSFFCKMSVTNSVSENELMLTDVKKKKKGKERERENIIFSYFFF